MLEPQAKKGKPKKRTFCFLLLLLLASCGFKPLYGPQPANEPSVAEALGDVAIDNIPDREGQILRNHLIDRLYTKGRPSTPSMNLKVVLGFSEIDLGIQKDATASRRQVTLQADYALRNKTGKKLFEGAAHSVVSYSKLEAQYGTVTARRNATARAIKEVGEQIVNRLSLYLAENNERRPALDRPSFLLPPQAQDE